MSGKYYINWYNILPITIDNYQKSQINNINTPKLLNNYKDEIIDQNNTLYDYSGLWIGEIYNIYYFFNNTNNIFDFKNEKYYCELINKEFNLIG